MKKLMIAGMFFAGVSVAYAQETLPKEKVEVKKTATIEQTVNNVINPDDK